MIDPGRGRMKIFAVVVIISSVAILVVSLENFSQSDATDVVGTR